jgi:3-deoxy-D-arabino-heptulosonate 7-phosphate (DAHP) synthase class II
MNANASPAYSVPSDIRRFRLEHALEAIENALILLDTKPAEAIEVAALERVRDDLAILLRVAVAA